MDFYRYTLGIALVIAISIIQVFLPIYVFHYGGQANFPLSATSCHDFSGLPPLIIMKYSYFTIGGMLLFVVTQIIGD